VIVVALFIVALVAAMAVTMMSRLDRDIQRTTLILRDVQAEFYAQGSIAWAMDQLITNWEKQKPNQLIDTIPMRSPVNQVRGYKVSSTIYDMQARFNVNNLAATEAQALFVHLMKILVPNVTDAQAQSIVRATVDWITPGSARSELSRSYLELPTPYRAAHRPMLSASELRLVRGVTPAIFNVLQPYITALPGSIPVNVQTAPVPILAALGPAMTVDAAKILASARATKPFVTVADFQNTDIVKNHPIPAGLVAVTSQYFLVETEVAIEKQRLVLYTLMERATKKDKAAVTILWQSKGIW
jgi:general secretion pathway protein K